MTLAVTDHATVERAQAGDVDVVADLYRRYHRQVWRLVFHRCGRDEDLADDLTADVFVKALKYLPTYRDQGKDIGAWLGTMAHRVVIDHFKKSRTRLESPVAFVVDRPDGDVAVSPEIAVLSAELWRQVAGLHPDWSAVLVLRFRDGWSPPEIAEFLGQSVASVKALQYRALRRLQAEAVTR